LEGAEDDLTDRGRGGALVESGGGKFVAARRVVGAEKHIDTREELREVPILMFGKIRMMNPMHLRSAEHGRQKSQAEAQICMGQEEPGA
jgi:hypothetical protein